MTDGTSDGMSEAATQGVSESTRQGASESATQAASEAATRGASESPTRGAPENAPDNATAGTTAGAAEGAPAGTVQQPSFGRWMGSMWLYTTLRFALFFALWGILLLVGLQTLFAAFLALVLSVPLSYVLLAKPRRAFTATLEARVDARRVERSALDRDLDPEAEE